MAWGLRGLHTAAECSGRCPRRASVAELNSGKGFGFGDMLAVGRNMGTQAFGPYLDTAAGLDLNSDSLAAGLNQCVAVEMN
jgi:hypothetical protein